jgi:hypothetical protein
VQLVWGPFRLEAKSGKVKYSMVLSATCDSATTDDWSWDLMFRRP